MDKKSIQQQPNDYQLDRIGYIKIILVFVGLVMVLPAPFVDLSWLKAIADSYAPDGDCARCEVLNNPEVILIPLGLFLLSIAFFLREILTWKISESKWYVLLVLVILGGFLLRVNLAHKTVFWQDEAESAIDTINLYQKGELSGSYRNLPINYGAVGAQVDGHFFKYAHYNPDRYAYHGWLTFVISGTMLIFGKSTFLMRLPFSVLFLLSAVLLYVLSVRLTHDESIAMLATLLYSTNSILILDEMQLRYYSLTIFIAILLLFILLLLQYNNNKRNNIFVALTLLLAYHTHLGLFAALLTFVLYFHVQHVKKITDGILFTFIFLLIQSYLFNQYTNWEIHHHVPIFRHFALIYLKLFYSIALAIIIIIKQFQNRINNSIAAIDLDRPSYVLALVFFGFYNKHHLPIGIIILCSVIIFIYLKSNAMTTEKYFLIYSFLFILIISFTIKPRVRNILPCIPIMLVISSCLIVRLILKAKRVGWEFKIFTMCLLLMFTGSSVKESISVRDIGQNGYLPELIRELKHDKYQKHKVFVEYNHFPLLFYTNLEKLYYIWNINPDYFTGSKEKYFIILQPASNKTQCSYYYNNIPALKERCKSDPRFFLEYVLGENYENTTLKSGARILECN